MYIFKISLYKNIKNYLHKLLNISYLKFSHKIKLKMDNDKNNSLEDDIRPPDEVIKECLLDYEYDDFNDKEYNNNDKEDNNSDDIDEELKLALSVSKRDYIDNIQEDTIFTNIVDESTYENLDYALEISKIEYEEYLDKLKNERLNEEEEHKLMKLEEERVYQKMEIRKKSLEFFCKKIERLTYCEEDRKMRSYIMSVLDDWFNLKIDCVYIDQEIYQKIYKEVNNYYLNPYQKNYTKFAISKEEDEIVRSIFLTK